MANGRPATAIGKDTAYSAQGPTGGCWGRRDFIRVGSLGALGLNLAGYLNLRKLQAATAPADRSCILIWLGGGPAHQDLWDMKPDAPKEFRGEFKPISTNVPGIQVGELLPHSAKLADKYTIIRSMTGIEGEHEQAMSHMLTGYRPLATLSFPALGAVVAKEKGQQGGLPPYIAIPMVGYGYGPGFLGTSHGAFASGDPNIGSYRVRDMELPTDVDWSQISDRRYLVKQMDASFQRDPLLQGADTEGRFSAIDESYEKAISLMTSNRARKAFDIWEESDQTRERYGRTSMGQGCLLARRLIEAGTRFVTVSLAFNEWDTHGNNFNRLKERLVPPFDQAYAALLTDLADRGMLDSTLVIATGEFGRTPKVNGNAGRDHWAKVWSCLMAGAGIPGGHVHGSSDAIASEVKDNPVTVEDFSATVYDRLGIDYSQEYETPIGRPVRLSMGAHLTF